MTKDVLFSSIGLSYINGVEHATDFLMSRQAAVGSAVEWSGAVQVERSVMGKFWKKPDMASYALELVGNDGSYASKLMFVGFKRCSEKLRFVLVAELGVIEGTASQFYFPTEPADSLSQYDVTAEQVCTKIEDACGVGANSPYSSKLACRTQVGDMKSRGRVLCNRFDRDEDRCWHYTGILSAASTLSVLSLLLIERSFVRSLEKTLAACAVLSSAKTKSMLTCVAKPDQGSVSPVGLCVSPVRAYAQSWP